MILNFVNSSKPIAAEVLQSPWDNEPVLLPLTEETQFAWDRRAKSNLKTKYKTILDEICDWQWEGGLPLKGATYYVLNL